MISSIYSALVRNLPLMDSAMFVLIYFTFIASSLEESHEDN